MSKILYICAYKNTNMADVASTAAGLAGMSTPLGLGLAGLGVAGNLYSMYQSSQAQKRAQRQLDALNNQPIPQYGVDPAWKRYYQQATNQAANPMGFTGAETGSFQQNLARTLAAQRANATQLSGGNLGRAINSMNVGANVNALNTFAGQDAALRRQQQNAAYGRQAQGAGVFQNVGNMNTQTALSRRLMQEQALGNAIRQQRDYQQNTVSGIGGDLLGAGLTGLMYGGADKSTATNLPFKFEMDNAIRQNKNFRLKSSLLGN